MERAEDTGYDHRGVESAAERLLSPLHISAEEWYVGHCAHEGGWERLDALYLAYPRGLVWRPLGDSTR